MCTTMTARAGRSRPTTRAAATAVPPGPAEKEALLAGDPAGGREAVAVADGDDAVDDRRVVGGRPEVLADALDQIRATRSPRVHRPLRVGADDLDRGVLLLQIPSDPDDRPAGADAGHEVGDPAAGLLPDLRTGRLVLGPRVVGVVVLVGLPGAGDLAGPGGPTPSSTTRGGRARTEVGQTMTSAP